MLVTQLLEELEDWTRKNICPEIKLLKPNDAQMGSEYTPEYVHPEVFKMFIPAEGMLPKGVETKFPAICIQVTKGEEDLNKHEEYFWIQYAFCVWNPGNYKKTDVKGENGEKTQKIVFERNAEGWRDAWNFLDKAKRIIQSKMYLPSGLKVSRDETMKFGMFTEEDGIVVSYPEWYVWLSFKIYCGTAGRVNTEYDNLL